MTSFGHDQDSTGAYAGFFDGFHEEVDAVRHGGADQTGAVNAEQVVLDNFFAGFHEDVLRVRLGLEPTAPAIQGLTNEVARRRQQ